MAKTLRHLHLVGATGEIRTASYNDREHLVVPVVAMVEGVVWASNSEVPEFVPAEELAQTPQQWDGRGCFAGHPKDGGTQVTANTPRTLETSFGLVFNTANSARILKTRRLEMEAYLDPVKAEEVGPEAADVIRRLRAGERIEVSVGAYVEAEDKDGEHNGQEFHGIWRNIVSDHLAFLAADEKGACSVAAGCGAPRTATRHLITAEGIEREVEAMPGATTPAPKTPAPTPTPGPKPSQPTGPHPSPTVPKKASSWERFMSFVTSLRDSEGMSDRDVRNAVDAALRAVEPGYMGIDTLYPEDGLVIFYVAPEDEYQAMRRDYSLKDGKATLGELREKVEPKLTYVAADANEAVVTIPAPKVEPTKKDACGCAGGDKKMAMDKVKKAELIAALVTDANSGFKEGDESFLETASDERLLEFQTLAASRKVEAEAKKQAETDARNAAARLKVAEDKLKTATEAPTEEAWLANAPASIKTLIERQKAQDAEQRTLLVAKLKTAQSEYTEAELTAMDMPMLERLSRAIKVETPDFAGRGVPVPRGAGNSTETFAPPDPYKAGLDAMRASSKAVN